MKLHKAWLACTPYFGNNFRSWNKSLPSTVTLLVGAWCGCMGACRNFFLYNRNQLPLTASLQASLPGPEDPPGPSLLQMSSSMHVAALPCLSLMLLLCSPGPWVQGQEFQFGPCRVEGVVLQKLWQAFWAVKDIVQAQDNITSVQLLRKEVLQNVPETESCHLIHALLRFYVNTVFKSYRDKAVEFGILKSFSTLANNFFVIVSKLQASEKMFSTRETARRRFLLFHRAFKQLDREAAVTKAFGEMDILLSWMEKFYQL